MVYVYLLSLSCILSSSSYLQPSIHRASPMASLLLGTSSMASQLLSPSSSFSSLSFSQSISGGVSLSSPPPSSVSISGTTPTLPLIYCGKGDRKTAKGKRRIHSFGNSRPKDKNKGRGPPKSPTPPAAPKKDPFDIDDTDEVDSVESVPNRIDV